MRTLAKVDDLFVRSLLWRSLLDSVREAQLAPKHYLSLPHGLLTREQDESLAQSLATHTSTALHRYVDPDFFFQAEDGIRDLYVTGVQTCALPISPPRLRTGDRAPLR